MIQVIIFWKMRATVPTCQKIIMWMKFLYLLVGVNHLMRNINKCVTLTLLQMQR